MTDTMNRRAALRLALSASAGVPLLASTGCATLRDLLGDLVQEPTIQLRDMTIKGLTLTSIQTEFIADIVNPNPFGFALAGVDWLIKLAGGQVATGNTPGGLAVAARRRTQQKLAIDFDIAKTAQAVLDLIGKATIPYEVEAVGHLKARQFKFDLPARIAGAMPMPKLPTFAVPTFAVTSSDLSGVAFRVDSLVTNPNAFALPIDGFQFDVKVGGRNVLQNKALRGLSLAPGTPEKLPLEFKVSLVDLGLSLAQLAQNPRLDWQVGAEVASGFLKLPFKQSGRVVL